jgi:hypothetical protein
MIGPVSRVDLSVSRVDLSLCLVGFFQLNVGITLPINLGLQNHISNLIKLVTKKFKTDVGRKREH